MADALNWPDSAPVRSDRKSTGACSSLSDEECWNSSLVKSAVLKASELVPVSGCGRKVLSRVIGS